MSLNQTIPNGMLMPVPCTWARKFFLVPFFLLLVLATWAQTGRVSGRILDSQTVEPLAFANVFINNTTIGTASDINGEFLLSNIPVGTHEIIFSFVGYRPYQTRISVEAGGEVKVTVRLIADEIKLETVEVTGSRDKVWDNQLIKFEKIFFGTSENAALCKIVNPWVLEFTESEDVFNPLFIAKASQPLEINNVALGYHIFFYLKDFKAGAQNYSIVGNMRFEEMKTDDKTMAGRWTENRRTVYEGSDRHLFKAILDKQVKEQGFQLYSDKPGNTNTTTRTNVFSQELGKSIIRYNPTDLVSPGKRPGEFRIKMQGRVEIHYLNAIASKKVYRDVPYAVAWMEIASGYVEVNALGVPLNSLDIVTSGYMSSARVSDMLPYDYEPSQSIDVMKEDQSWTIEGLKFKRLQERVYLHTDKPYYYGGEMIWFKGYLHYTVPELFDSLSRVLYVELISPEKKVVSTNVLPIDSGRVAGNIFLADTIKTGNYFLRAYTQWMMNYPGDEIFVKSVPILPLSVFVDSTAVDPKKDSTHIITISSQANTYSTRSKVIVDIQVAGLSGQPLQTEFSVSVTDMNQVKPVAGERNILGNYYFRSERLNLNPPDRLLPIEFGIGFSGAFANDKGKPEKADLMVIQGKMEDMVTITTDEVGHFWLNGFQFMDTAQFSFQAKNSKGKPYGKVTLFPRAIPKTDFTEVTLPLSTRSSTDPQRYKMDYHLSDDARLLEAVTISATTIDDVRVKEAIVYGDPDYTVKGDDLLNASAGNIVPALQGRIPGLQVVPFWDETGIQRYKIRIRGGSSSFGVGGTTEPLLLIDGIPIMDGGFVADQIAAINPANVARIEVITRADPRFGVRGTNGVIAVYTKQADLLSVNNRAVDPSKFQTLPVVGYSKPAKFYAPNYENKNADHTLPDYRSTIFWAPWLSSKADGKAQFEFFTSDLPATYRIVLEGITEAGDPMRAESFITVKNQ